MQRRVISALSVLVVAIGASACTASDAAIGGASSTSDVEVVGGDEEGTVRSASSEVEQPVGGSDQDFCSAISAIQSADFELEETFGDEARRLFDDVQSTAPREIADDVGTVVATLEAIAELGVSTDENDPEAIDAAFEILLDPDFTEANENLATYTSDACGIDLSEGDDVEIDDLGGFDDLDGFDDSE